jgi:hypothetical protein
VGVRSAANRGDNPAKRAHYHVYDIEPSSDETPGSRFRVRVRIRGWDADSGRFVDEGERTL